MADKNNPAVQTDPNTRIASAMATDPKWREWAYVPCPCNHADFKYGEVCDYCHGRNRLPRDFAAHWPKLVEWAAQQEWYLAGATFEQSCCYRLGQAVLVFVEGRSTSAEVGENVRDIIAARLEEIDDAD